MFEALKNSFPFKNVIYATTTSERVIIKANDMYNYIHTHTNIYII